MEVDKKEKQELEQERIRKLHEKARKMGAKKRISYTKLGSKNAINPEQAEKPRMTLKIESVEGSLMYEIQKISKDKKQIDKYAKQLEKKYGIPYDLLTDYLTERKSIATASPEITSALREIFGLDNNAPLEQYHWRYSIDSVPKQLAYDMIQIDDDQWIGKITVRELMQLREAGLVNYNENAQRVMKHVTRGKEEFYIVSVNKKAVLSMEELFENGQYIPNTITLNMPEDTNFSYRNGTLTIKNIDHFDITDGYHRYLAMSNLYDDDENFDYPMELRITNYSEDKSRQLIWQEDQKTKMSRIDSESMNTNSLSNKVVQRLNINKTFLLAGQINVNRGIINAADMAEIIRATYFPVSKIFSKKKEIETIKIVTDELAEGINTVVEEDLNLAEKPWGRAFLYCLVYNINNHVALEDLLNETYRMTRIANERKMFKGRREVARVDMKKLAEMRKEPQ